MLITGIVGITYTDQQFEINVKDFKTGDIATLYVTRPKCITVTDDDTIVIE